MKKSTKQMLFASLMLCVALFGSEAFAVGTSYLSAADVTAATDNIIVTFDDVKTKTFPLIMMVTGFTIAVSLFKKFTKKAV